MSRLVLDEYRNLRAESAREAVEALRRALTKASHHLQLQEVYVPSPEEVVDDLIKELESVATVLELEPSDAAEALRREALRIRPAGRGSGARDCAIWLSICRHHSDSGVSGAFFTTNTRDYAARQGREEPHPQLVQDLGKSIDRFKFVFQPYEFIKSVAPPVSHDGVLPADVRGDAEFRSELARAIAASDLFTAEESGLDTGSDFTIWEIDDTTLSIGLLDPTKAFQLEDVVLCQARIKVELPLSISGTATIEGLLWLEVAGQDTSVIEIESLARR